MLRTNSKKAIENIWKYVEGFRETINEELVSFEENPNYIQDGDKKTLAAYIYNYYYETYKKNNYKAGTTNDQELFYNWAQGLTMCGMFDFFLYREETNPKNILGEILEETETEKKHFTDDQAAYTLTALIYREVIKNK